MRGLYVHVPFCVRKCGYCDFYSEVSAAADVERYLAALDRELSRRSREFGPFKPETIFFGGGTPTRLDAAQLARLGESIHRSVDCSGVVEWTCEINPGTLDADKARVLAAMGVNRASFGVQSFNPKHLAALDRAHEAGKLNEALAAAGEAGIARLSLDLMFALPEQTLAEWSADLERALAHGTEHLSLYNLTFEDDTPLTALLRTGAVQPLSDDLEAAMYGEAVERCAAAGLERYEVSNFARRGRESRHNLLYWRCEDWLGIGPGAHSAHGNRRWANVADHRDYARRLLEEDSFPLAFEEDNLPEAVADEILLMGLRLRDGVAARRFAARCGLTIPERCGPALDELAGLGLIAWDGGTLRVSERGFSVLDRIVLELTRAPMHLETMP